MDKFVDLEWILEDDGMLCAHCSTLRSTYSINPYLDAFDLDLVNENGDLDLSCHQSFTTLEQAKEFANLHYLAAISRLVKPQN